MKKWILPCAFVIVGCSHHAVQTEVATTSKVPVTDQKELGHQALNQMQGCFLVDYSYIETEPLQANYRRDPRIYDVNLKKAVKEWIFLERYSTDHYRLQHILFAVGADGKLNEDSFLKHQAEDWDYAADYLYEYTQPLTWEVRRTPDLKSKWVRRVTNLDDGPRYQCAGLWTQNAGFNEYSCEGDAPIPGRETRDMGRKDYNALQRTTRLISYDSSWLERQNNIKMTLKPNKKEVLAKEVAKNWYVRLPDSDCQAARGWAEKRKNFWTLLRQTWDQVLTGETGFKEKKIEGAPPRFEKITEIEVKYMTQDLKDSKIRTAAQDEIKKQIETYRFN